MIQDSRGFTLIELIVAISIVVLFATFSLANYPRLSGQKELEGSAQTVVDTLELARKKALAGDQTDFTCTTDANGVALSGYRVTFTLPRTYALQECCHSSCGDPHNLSTSTVLASVSFSLAPAEVFFSNSGSVGSPQTIRLRNAAISQCIDIGVAANGLITLGSRIPC